ncbi:bb3-type cytochrome oxidase subunit III [Pelomonas sp. SE-A7]|uniref:bb3-type cytochrome oxidase subunit III n=1 Tax=Pelomonas sp. SE-A7 TaxID=3054953 RepID=UPI00259CDCBD|nr:bb3-type cytochrome oxidase subunit III [Pelomonas sp. SE-A7]MDM4766478.1 bb3-type cytochrome oxidase subunit III [Pelomonas sp. SE-A7]
MSSSVAMNLPLQQRQRLAPGAAASIALWFFMAVATSLFSLFLVAYVMRLDGLEGYPLALPWQFWLSTGLLVAGSAALELAWRRNDAGLLSVLGGALALGFVLSQLWGWQVLSGRLVLPVGNPAGSFLYLLTAMHGLHVVGGLGGWWVARRAGGEAWRLRLLARYWHFLLGVWLVLFGVLGWMTPELVRVICGVAR